jgi:hypothetical protein
MSAETITKGEGSVSSMTRPAGFAGSAGRLAADTGFCVRMLQIRVLVLAAVLACLSTLAVVVFPSAGGSGARPVVLRHGLHSRPAAPLPTGLAPAASAAIAASDHSFWPVRHGASLAAQGGGIDSSFTVSGADLHVAQGTLGLSLLGVGRGQRVELVGTVAPTTAANQVIYRHRSISEFYRNGPFGLEQGFTMHRRPLAGTGSLVLAVGIKGTLAPEQVGSQVLFRTPAGATALRYGQLSARDASGRWLPARMQIRSGTLLLRIDDRNARYPVRIDPIVQQGEKLTSGSRSNEEFGLAVAVSADGNTALIGGAEDTVWVFTRSGGSTWTQQGSTLTGSGGFGLSVALSADGNTALIGGQGDNNDVGAAWVFTRSGGSTFTQQGAKLTGGGESEEGHFGASVALSGDGTTALIGGYQDGENGAAWVFTRSGSTWTQQGAKLTGSGAIGAEFGVAVALSDDGNTALIGGFTDNELVGAAWVFTRSGSTWTQQGAKLTGSGEVGEGDFGVAVALSGDGNTALIGGYEDSNDLGAAWVFTRSGSTWTQQGAKLTGGGESEQAYFGLSVALSGGGTTALIGGDHDNKGIGAAWVFTRSGSTWTQQGAKLTGGGESGAAGFGEVALSGDGTTALIGGGADNFNRGAAWAFALEEAPEYGRCIKITKGAGVYKTASCTTLAAAGSYEWFPGVVNHMFTTKLTEGTVTLETVTKRKIVCQTASSRGEYTGTKEVGNVLGVFTGCEALGTKCSTPEFEQGEVAEGEIVTEYLEGTLGIDSIMSKEGKETKHLGLDLFPAREAHGTGLVLEAICGNSLPSVDVRGSIIVPVASNKMALTQAQVYKARKGRQAQEQFEGQPTDVLEASLAGGAFEQSGLTMTTTQASEEAVEINSVF